MTLEHDHSAHDSPADRHDDHAGHDHGHDHDGGHGGHEHVAYPDAVEAYRAEKDEHFRGAAGSPIPIAQRQTFSGLPYFDVDEALRFEGLELEPYAGSEPVQFQIPTSDGQLREAQRAGVFRFAIAGMTHTLTGYALASGDSASGDSASVFVPFFDLTSGHETYGAGRYLDVYPEGDGTYALDFNLAYHPSCVYDLKFSCPITPAENRLPIRIEAGERLPIDSQSAEGAHR